MFSHTLYSRPIVINDTKKIQLKFKKENVRYEINCDGQSIFSIKDTNDVFIKKSKRSFRLIHPKDYNYFNVLNRKLGWEKK